MSQPNVQNNINVPAGEDFNTRGLEGSMQQILSENVGVYVDCDFLIGTTQLVRRSGILYAVGTSFLVLYDEDNDSYLVCDVFSVKFVNFYDPASRPAVLPNSRAE